MNIIHAHSYAIHPTPWKLYSQARVFMLAVLGFVALLVFSTVDGALSFTFRACLLFVPAAFLLFLRHTTIVDVEERSVRRELRWLGHYRVWRRDYPFEKFDSVTVRRIVFPHGSSERFRIYLTQRSGNRLLVRVMDTDYNDAHGAGRQAGELARKLSEDLHVPLVEPLMMPAR